VSNDAGATKAEQIKKGDISKKKRTAVLLRKKGAENGWGWSLWFDGKRAVANPRDKEGRELKREGYT